MAVDAARAKSLFLNASELADLAERAAYLERECGGDAELRQRVVALWPPMTGADDPWRATPPGRPNRPHQRPRKRPRRSTRQRAWRRSWRPPKSDRTARTSRSRAPAVNSPGGSGVGQVIAGRYTLRDVLGEGGMGTVYRADQAAPVKRRVALKLIKVGMDSRACWPASTPSGRRWP